jgi:hypothetical protein
MEVSGLGRELHSIALVDASSARRMMRRWLTPLRLPTSYMKDDT